MTPFKARAIIARHIIHDQLAYCRATYTDHAALCEHEAEHAGAEA